MSRDQFQKLFDFLDEHLGDCDDTLKLTEIFLLAIGIADKERISKWLGQYGGYCDCEVLANVEEHFNYTTTMCHHLQPLENYLKEKRIPETFRGKAWSQHCREWIYFDCILKTERLKAKLHLPSFVVTHENLDNKSGTELGLVCNICEDGIMGEHPDNPSSPKKTLVD